MIRGRCRLRVGLGRHVRAIDQARRKRRREQREGRIGMRVEGGGKG